MLVGFDKWWQEDGKMIDPDTEDVPWFDKRKSLAEMAFEAGIKCGMARAANYVADDAEMPERVDFANGRFVRIVDNPTPGVHLGVFLEVGQCPVK
jgi:hypothetical protein